MDLLDSKGVDGEALQRRADDRSAKAPPEDALDRKSVSLFFTFMGVIPLVLFFLVVAGGYRPFGL